MPYPKRFICHKTKAIGVLKDKCGRIFSAKSYKKDGTPRTWVAKLAKSAEFDRKHPHVLVRDMQKGGAFRKMDLTGIVWVCDKNEEIYFHG